VISPLETAVPGFVPAFDWSTLRPDEAPISLIPEALARKLLAFPARLDGGRLIAVLARPDDYAAIRSLEARSRVQVVPVAGNPGDIRNAIDIHYSAAMPEAVLEAMDERFQRQGANGSALADAVRYIPLVPETEDDEDGANNAELVVHAVDSLIAQASKARATDIHIEPLEDRVRVRFRIDGFLQEAARLPRSSHGALISRLKVMAGMDIADRRLPQDGHFAVRVGSSNIDVRAATAATVHGEMAVLRILNKSLRLFSLQDLGLQKYDAAALRRLLKAPYGIILVAGPTGAGKTTTLYAALNELDALKLNIVTIEDPVEYRFDGINSMQVNEKTNLTFASSLRAVLRLDPDVILVGEIRDSETAHVAVQAALTGHLVLSSVHANDAIRAVTRMVDLGVEPFLLSSALLGVVAQRMVRKIDTHCTKSYEPNEEEFRALGSPAAGPEARFFEGEGCYFCSFTGYHGRTGLFEVLAPSDEFKALVLRSVGQGELLDQALADGFRTMRQDGVQKAIEGVTTPFEVLRSVYTL